MNKLNDKKKVLLLQRAIPHYRTPLFKLLSKQENFALTICTAPHDFNTSTGLPSKDLEGLNIKNIRIWKIGNTMLFQEVINLRDYDVVIMDISINLLSNPIYFLMAKLNGVRIIGWGKGIPQRTDRKENFIKKLYKKFVIYNCDVLILYGKISERYFNNLGFVKKPKFIAQNTVDTDWLIDNKIQFVEEAKLLRAKLNLIDKFIFGYFGKLSPRKGIVKILEAFKKVRDQNEDVVLVIAGSGDELDKVILFKSNWIHGDSIIILGKIEQGKEGVILNFFDAYLSFSQGGLGILEAMASSCLIISTPEIFPETELLQHNENCLLSQDFTVESFADAMQNAIYLGELKNELKNNALKTLKLNASISNMIEAFQMAINKAANV